MNPFRCEDRLPVTHYCSIFLAFRQTPGKPTAARVMRRRHRAPDAHRGAAQTNSVASPARDDARNLPTAVTSTAAQRGVHHSASSPINPETTDSQRSKCAFARVPARAVQALWAMIPLLLCPTNVLANAIGAVNDARIKYCGVSRIDYQPLTESRSLNEVARLLAHGRSFGEAERRAGYRAARSLWIRVTGASDDASVERLVRRQFCGQLADPRLRKIGTYRHGKRELWIVIAKPFTTPPEKEAADVIWRVLELTNQARAHGRTCGRRRFPPAPPLSLAPALTHAARVHSLDMAAHSFFSHTGSDGSSPGERVTRAGYSWSEVGENIASGVSTPSKVVADWLASPHHCANIMTASFRQMGVAFAVNRKSKDVIYWTEDFGRPR